MVKVNNTFGVIVGNRNFFPNQLADEGRKRLLTGLEAMGYRTIALSPTDTNCGAVETREDALRCAHLFSEHKKAIDGVIISLPNFGDERAVADALRFSGLDVPVMVHAYPDEIGKLDSLNRRDAFCGKLSLCNNLTQYGIRFSNTTFHVEDPDTDVFRRDVESFAAVCDIVKGLRQVRIGAVGVRPAPFNTVRFSEKILEHSGITVETIDLSEIIAHARKLDVAASNVTTELARIKSYVCTEGIPQQALERTAKLSVALNDWTKRNALDAIALQCWTALEELYGIVPCTIMSMFSENLLPAACETDVMGALSMYTLVLTTGTPAAIVDWNNNYGNDENKVITFHCSNFPISFFEKATMSYQDIIAGVVGKENTYGTCVGRIAPGPATFFRLSTDDVHGRIICYATEGRYTDDELVTFGGYGVAEIKGLRRLLTYITKTGFEHHVAVTRAHVGKILEEAITKYLGWDLYYHTGK